MFQNGFNPASTVNEQILLVSLNMYPTRDYHDQWRRSYTLQMTGQTEQALQNMLGRYGPDRTFSIAGMSELNSIGGSGGPGSSATAAGGLIRYSAKPTVAVGINNGWATRRLRFELTVQTNVQGIPRYREIIVGHTDYYGSSNLNGRAVLDPAMVYTIDSIVREPIEITQGVAGMSAMNQVGSADVVITNQNPIANPFTSNGQNFLYTMRPQDVFTVADSTELINGAATGDFIGQNGMMEVNKHTYIADTTLNHAARPSNRRNDLLNSYTSRLMTNMYQSSALQASPAANEFLSPQTQAMLAVKEQSMSNYSFPHCITRLAGGTCSTTGQFTQAELLRLDATIDDRTVVFSEHEDSSFQLIPTMATATASGINDHAIIASMTSNTVLALMNTHGFMKLSCTISNYSGTPICLVESGVGPNEFNREVLTNAFEKAVMLELGNVIANSGVGSYRIHVYAEAYNIVQVKVQLNGEIQETPFVFPSWASSAGTPVVSNDFNQLSSLAETVNSIVGSVTSRNKAMSDFPGMAGFPGASFTPMSSAPVTPTILGANGNPMSDFPSAPLVNPAVNW